MSDHADPDPFPLPPCVEQVRAAAEELHKVVLTTPFPDLDEPSDDDLDSIVKQADDWGRAVEEAYGDLYGSQEREVGLLTLFRVPDPKVEILRSSIEGESRRATIKGEFHVVDRPASLDRAADLLGDVPSGFRTSLSHFHPQVHGGGIGVQVAGRNPVHDIPVDREHWPQIREVYTERYRSVVFQALGLVAWVRERILALENAVVPTVRAVRRASRHAVLLEVRQAGQNRRVEITDAQYSLLAKLQTEGAATAARSAKSDLIKRVPELRAWIGTDPERTAGGGGQAIYTIPFSLREGLELELDT